LPAFSFSGIIKVVITKPSTCKGCPLYSYQQTGFVPATLPGVSNGVLIVAEAPGEQEEILGKVLVGTSGQHFDTLLKTGNMDRSQFALHNVLSCRPPGNALRGASYEFQAIAHCTPNLEETIKRVKPKVIVALGAVPLKRLCGLDGIHRHRGYVLRGPEGTWVVPTFHPSFLLPRRGQKSTSSLTPAVIRDLQLALHIAKHGFERTPQDYLEDPSPMAAMRYAEEYEQALAEDPTVGLSCDIETPYKLTVKDEEKFDTLDTTITRISFCFKAGYAISVPWSGEYMPFIRRMLGSSGRKWWFNGYTFDIPIVREAGVEVNGIQEDVMWAWHMLMPDLPRGLESVTSYFAPDITPWKHESVSRPAYYSCVDADAAWRDMMGIEKQLRKNNQWELYQKHVVKLDPYLQEAGRNGIYIDRKARRKLYKKLRKEENRLLREVQGLIPDHLRPLKHYKKFPVRWEGKREIRSVDVPKEVKTCERCGQQNVTKGEHTSRKGGKKGVPLNPCYKANIILTAGSVTEYDVVMDFNPLSTDQLISYLHHVNHAKDVRGRTEGGELSVDDFELEKLIGKYPEFRLYPLVQDLRTIRKTISTYVAGLKPNAMGVVSTEYTYAPATGRLSSRGLQKGSDKGTNLQNIPHRDDHPYADDIRSLIIPRPGYVYVQADSSSIEAVATGVFMDDLDYIEIAKKGVHAYMCCKKLGLDFTPENVKFVKENHKGLYERKKRTNHGVNYGMGADYMHKLWPKEFPTRAAAQREIKELYEILPKLKKFHHEVRVRANKDKFLTSPWGYRRYFYNVFTYVRDKAGNVVLDEKGKPKIKLGEDGNAVIAQLPQNMAAAFMRDNAPVIAKIAKQRGWIIPGNFLVHDSYCLEVPKDKPEEIEAAKNLLATVLTRPIPEMGGVRVGCDIQVGEDWGEGMKTVKAVKV